MRNDRFRAPRRHAREPSATRRAGAGGTLLGIFIGLLLGLGLAAAVAFTVTGGWRAYRAQLSGNTPRDAKDPAKTAKADADKPRFDFYKILPGNEEPKVQPERKAVEKAPDRSVAERAAERTAGRTAEAPPHSPSEKASERSAEKGGDRSGEHVAVATPATSSTKAASGERFWLQAGSFASEPDAENLKARLALSGWEASVQQGVLPDKSVRFRVRLGPYDNADELNRIKGELGRRGFDVAVIKF